MIVPNRINISMHIKNYFHLNVTSINHTQFIMTTLFQIQIKHQTVQTVALHVTGKSTHTVKCRGTSKVFSFKLLDI